MARALGFGGGRHRDTAAETPLIAMVRLRKRNEWVLPKGSSTTAKPRATPRNAR